MRGKGRGEETTAKRERMKMCKNLTEGAQRAEGLQRRAG